MGAVPHLPPPLPLVLPPAPSRRVCSRLAPGLLLLQLLSVLLQPQAARADTSLERCRALRQGGDLPALRDEQRRLQDGLQPEVSTSEALTSAEALLACRASQAALAVLESSPPPEGELRDSWLLLQWRAAHAGLHHAQAVQALALMADGDLSRLESLPLPVSELTSADQKPRQRAALDLLADHLVSLQAHRQAAEVLLASSQPGAATAARWGRAAVLATHLPRQQRDELMERALEQAAAAEAWGLVAALLDQQLADGLSDEASRRALERRLRLSERIDDAYGEWLQRRRQADPAQDPRVVLLEDQLRSPRHSGGHAAPQLPPPIPSP